MRNRFEDEGYRAEWARDRDNERGDRSQSFGQERERHFGGYDRDRDANSMTGRGQRSFENRDESAHARGQYRPQWEGAAGRWDEDRNVADARGYSTSGMGSGAGHDEWRGYEGAARRGMSEGMGGHRQGGNFGGTYGGNGGVVGDPDRFGSTSTYSRGAPGMHGMRSGFGGSDMSGYGHGGAQYNDRFRGSRVDSHLSQPGYYGERWGESRWGSENNADRDRQREGESFGKRVMHGLSDGVRTIFGNKTAKGPKGYTRSDERIREDVCDRLSQLSLHDDVDASEVEVMVKAGEVTLTGSVPERHWKHMVEDTAENVHGVTDVHNQLRVKREREVGSTTGTMGTGMGTSTTSSQTSQTGQTGMTEAPTVDNGSRRNMPQRS